MYFMHSYFLKPDEISKKINFDGHVRTVCKEIVISSKINLIGLKVENLIFCCACKQGNHTKYSYDINYKSCHITF